MKKAVPAEVCGLLFVLIWCGCAVGADTPKETEKDGRFVAYDNGSVLDTKTNLMWAAKDNGSPLSWPDATSYCEAYRGGGYSDWRLPTRDELVGLYDAASGYKLGDGSEVHLTKLIHLTGSSAWSSDADNSTGSAYIFSFRYGGNPVRRPQYKTFVDFDGRALPVRSVK
jgi:hypothetical protein